MKDSKKKPWSLRRIHPGVYLYRTENFAAEVDLSLVSRICILKSPKGKRIKERTVEVFSTDHTTTTLKVPSSEAAVGLLEELVGIVWPMGRKTP